MQRRRLLLVALTCLLLAAQTQAAEEMPTRPNILIVLTDDQGLGDFSFTGNPVVKTPHLDKFAREAVRLTDFHVAPMCSPTRGQLLMGVDALKNGVTSVTAGRTFPRPGFPMLPELFRAAGYKTGLFGKWHLGDNYPHRPTDRGFDTAVHHLGWGMLFAAPEFGNPLIDGRCFENNQPHKLAGHCTDYWFDRAIDWMKQRADAKEPFVCYLPTNAPHTPHQELPEYVAPYRERGSAEFFGMIAHIDKRFGDLDKFLAESGLADDTLVNFMTDNGGTAGVKLFNAGLRGHKTEYYEGGHRVPCWIRWPQGKFGASRDIEVPTQVQDILPTLLELCDVPSQGAKFDGVSLAGLLRGTQRTLPERAFVVQYSRDKVAKGDACVVRGKWRLVKDAELYDVSTDLEQQHDLAAKHPEIVRELRGHYETWWQQIGEQVDIYEPCATIGSPEQQDISLTSADWEGIYADNTGHIRRAVGGPRGGHWHVQVAEAGKYEFTLRRWPRETGTALGAGHNDPPEIARYAGLNYNPPAKTFPIAAGVVRIAGREAQAKTSPNAEDVKVTLELPAGKTTLSAWFQDAVGEDLCGAFFVGVVRKHK